MDIQIDKFKDYKVVKNPKASQMVDSSINKRWWNDDGWSFMYDSSPEKFKSELSSFTNMEIDPPAFKRPTEKSDKLQGVLDFLEKKEGKSNPLAAESKIKEIFTDPKALYVGKLGFGYLNDKNELVIFAFPVSGEAIEEYGEVKPFIIDVKDGGVAVWDDTLEKRIDGVDNYII